MNLHLPTLLLALLLGLLLLTLALGVSLKRLGTRPELRSWTAGCWALLLALVALELSPVIPLWLSMVAGNWLICLALAMYAHALHQFLAQKSAPRWMIAALALALLASIAMLNWPLHLRVAVMSLLYAALLWPSLWLIARRGWHAETSLRSVAVTLSLALLALLLRAVQALIQAPDHNDLLHASLGESLHFLIAVMLLMGASIGFVLAVFERVAVQLDELATHDRLTGCLNRSTTDAMLLHQLQLGWRHGTPVAFVLLDLDHFKLVNDRFGHRTGDVVLRVFAGTVRERLRQSDVLGRTGDEEFGLILPGTDLAGAQLLVERIRQSVEAMPLMDERARGVHVTLSAGIAVAVSDDELAPEQLYGRADKALYAAKRAGRNRVALYGSDGVPAFAPLTPSSQRGTLSN